MDGYQQLSYIQGNLFQPGVDFIKTDLPLEDIYKLPAI